MTKSDHPRCLGRSCVPPVVEGRKLQRTFAREVVIAAIALVFTIDMIYGAGSMSVSIGFLVYLIHLIGWIVMMFLLRQDRPLRYRKPRPRGRRRDPRPRHLPGALT